MARAFGWFLDAMMEFEPVQCCDCLCHDRCFCACDLKGCEDEAETHRVYGVLTGQISFERVA
jgi:hypothetical protein